MASTLMFWNKQNSTSQNGSEAKNTKNGRNWLHAPDVLVNGHVAYLVKFLGSTPVEQAKGIEVVKEAIRRLQFTQQMKKAEGGNNVKTKKVEITVSVDGVAIQEPRGQTILHQFPLHRISYCADEKGVKKFFSFIAKTSNGAPSLNANDDTNSTNSTNMDDGHECFVFISNKLASDITLTIGQAFDLAYRRYVSDGGKSLESAKLQVHNRQLEGTVNAYRQRLKDLSELVSKAELEKMLSRLGLRDICDVPALENGVDGHNNNLNGSKTPDLGIDVSLPNNDDQLLIETSPKHFAPIVPPRNIQNQINSTLEAFKPSVGTKLEGLLLNSDSDSDFDPRAPDNDTSNGGNKISNDLFGFEPPKQANISVGQQLFASNGHNNSFPNGNGATTNGFAAPISPPPILAPPPQKSAPRRTATTQQNSSNTNGNSYQDLFGSTPFNPQNCDDSTSGYHDLSDISASSGISFSEEVKILANNSSKLDTVLTFGRAGLFTDCGANDTTAGTGPMAPSLASKLNPFTGLSAPSIGVLRSNPLATVQHKSYDVFKNPSDKESLTAGTATSHSVTGGNGSACGSNSGGCANFSGRPSANTSIFASSASPPMPPTTLSAPSVPLPSSSSTPSTSCASASASLSGEHGAGVTAGSELTPSDALFEEFALSTFNEFKKDLSINSRTGKRPGSLQAQERIAVKHQTAVANGALTVCGDGPFRVGGPALLKPEAKTTKNGFFSSDDVLDTFDPLKK